MEYKLCLLCANCHCPRFGAKYLMLTLAYSVKVALWVNNNSKVVSAERGEDFLMMVFVYQMTKCREVATSCGLFCTGQVSGLWLTCALLHDKNIKTRHTSKFKRGNTSKKLLFCLMSLIHSHYPMAGFTDLLRQIMSL